jgi:hypothetical protein
MRPYLEKTLHKKELVEWLKFIVPEFKLQYNIQKYTARPVLYLTLCSHLLPKGKTEAKGGAALCPTQVTQQVISRALFCLYDLGDPQARLAPGTEVRGEADTGPLPACSQRLAHECLSQSCDSAKHSPTLVPTATKPDAVQPDSLPYPQYLAVIKAQIACAKDIHTALLDCANKVTGKTPAPPTGPGGPL